jgi:hypothetical protein
MSVIADVAVAPIILAGGLTAGVTVFLPIVLIESLVLWRLKWGSFRRSLVDSTIINIASTLCGLVLFVMFTLTAFQCVRVPAGDGLHTVNSCDWLVSPLIGLAVLWALTVAIEGGVLLLLKRHARRQTWIAALVSNAASYVLIGLGFLVLGASLS